MTRVETLGDGFHLLHGTFVTDSRGMFRRLADVEELREIVPGFQVAQVNSSLTRTAGTVRGMHYQRPPHSETKVVTCLSGAILDVAVNLRSGSPDFGKAFCWELRPDLGQSLIIGPGMAHGFQALVDNTIVHYTVNRSYHPDYEGGISAVSWPVVDCWRMPPRNLSTRDTALRPLSDYEGGSELMTLLAWEAEQGTVSEEYS